MDHRRLHVSINTPQKPSKIIALLALVFAFALPFILVKTFPHKQKPRFTNKSMALPTIIPLHSDTKEITAKTKVDPIEIKSAETKLESNSEKTQDRAAFQKNAVMHVNPQHTIKARPGDTLTSVFLRLGLSVKTLQQILHDTPRAKMLTKIQAGQEIQFVIKNKQLVQMTFPYSNTQYIVLYRNQTKYEIQVHTRKTTSQNHFLTATVHGSLYGSAKRNNIPTKLIQQMTEILAWDINFAKDVHSGDQFTISYNVLFIKDKPVGIGDILAVSYRNNGHNFQAIRHTDRTGHSDYYAPNGNSLKKAFNRYPLQFSHISSTFTLSRYHPILHYSRPHKGVDLAAPIGTPIHATADGRIEVIGRQGDYGNMIKIKHNKTYSTIYGHMLRFQKGLSRGNFVRLGQVIGYVGQSGLADGPHCHYELHINNQPRNPSTVPLPRGNPLVGQELATFKVNATRLLAQMNLFKNTRVATRSLVKN